MSIPNYSGPSPAAKRFTVLGVECAIDIYYNAVSSSVNMIVAEKLPTGAWDYLGGNHDTGWVWEIFTRNGLMGLGQNTSYTVPGGVPPWNGTFAEIVTTAGANNMVWPWIPTIMKWLLNRFSAGAAAIPNDGRTPDEVVAQQQIAAVISALTASVSGGVVTLGHA